MKNNVSVKGGGLGWRGSNLKLKHQLPVFRIAQQSYIVLLYFVLLNAHTLAYLSFLLSLYQQCFPPAVSCIK